MKQSLKRITSTILKALVLTSPVCVSTTCSTDYGAIFELDEAQLCCQEIQQYENCYQQCVQHFDDTKTCKTDWEGCKTPDNTQKEGE